MHRSTPRREWVPQHRGRLSRKSSTALIAALMRLQPYSHAHVLWMTMGLRHRRSIRALGTAQKQSWSWTCHCRCVAALHAERVGAAYTPPSLSSLMRVRSFAAIDPRGNACAPRLDQPASCKHCCENPRPCNPHPQATDAMQHVSIRCQFNKLKGAVPDVSSVRPRCAAARSCRHA